MLPCPRCQPESCRLQRGLLRCQKPCCSRAACLMTLPCGQPTTVNVVAVPSRWVRSLAFDPSNEWFCTGSADRTIKIWDVATGQLKLTLTGHIEQARPPLLVMAVT